MQLKRLILKKLIGWASGKEKKPLLLLGARQSGKTWLMKELGKTAFEHTAFFDFAERPELQEVFRGTRNPESILKNLRLLSEVPIEAGKTLIAFDEIQLSDTALGSLKYFAESAPEYAVIAGGSLLGVAVRKKNIFVPVGKVDIERIYPLSFSEFLLNAAPNLYEFAENLNSLSPVPEALMPRLELEYRRYLCSGGMPEAVSALLDGREMAAADAVLKNILSMYRLDFSQYATAAESMRISSVWDAIPGQLAKENSRFFFSQVKKGARSREYMPAVQWLNDAGLIMKVGRVSKPGMPLSAYLEPDIFKVYADDVGLLRVMANLPADVLLRQDEGFREFRGAVTENFAAASLARQLGFAPSYWSSGATAEVDFIVQNGTDVVPLEVKAGETLTGKSLSVYRGKFAPPYAMRFSMRNLRLDGGVLNIPLPLADWALKLTRLIPGQNAA